VSSPTSTDNPHLTTSVRLPAPGADARRGDGSVQPSSMKASNGLPIIGQSALVRSVRRLIEMAAPTPAPVLITGDTGTGKELVAQTLHALSSRAKGPFIAINSSAIPETLLEGEMFGHEKGAFTGAFERRAGSFELAHGGTIFLDEIAEMDLGIQAKLLRVLEDGMIRRLGGKSELKIDVRVLAATNRDPARALKTGALREDLYYRLNVVSIALPALRDRVEDIPLLVEAFIQEFNAKYDRRVRGADDEAIEILKSLPWRGNVRELRNTIERATIVCPGEMVTAGSLRALLPGAPQMPSPRGDVIAIPLGTPLRRVEREVILATLAQAEHNKTRTARILGISAKTLYNKLCQYGLGGISPRRQARSASRPGDGRSADGSEGSTRR
jgi:two-component system, NtrC family, response regulator HydG